SCRHPIHQPSLLVVGQFGLFSTPPVVTNAPRSSRRLEQREPPLMNRSSQEPDPALPRRVLRSARPGGTRVVVGSVEVGGPAFVVAAGPCAVESPAQLQEAAAAVSNSGAHLLRGGVFKPRTSPYA